MQRIAENDSPVYYQFDMWKNAPLKHGLFTRIGGVSQGQWGTLNIGGTVGDDIKAVEENGRRMYQTLDISPGSVCTVWQVHSADTVIARHSHPGRKWLARADGMVTDSPQTTLVMRFADCVPVLLYDPVQHVIGLAHAGWRGTVTGAAISTLHTMQATWGTRPADVQAAIGPSIGPDAYQVGEEVVEAVQDYFGTTDSLIKRADDGSAYLNLWEANRRDLARNEVQTIEIAGICTASNLDEFFSHRAEKGKTGRYGVVMALQDK